MPIVAALQLHLITHALESALWRYHISTGRQQTASVEEQLHSPVNLVALGLHCPRLIEFGGSPTKLVIGEYNTKCTSVPQV
jgi:hypothetical protein